MAIAAQGLVSILDRKFAVPSEASCSTSASRLAATPAMVSLNSDNSSRNSDNRVTSVCFRLSIPFPLRGTGVTSGKLFDIIGSHLAGEFGVLRRQVPRTFRCAWVIASRLTATQQQPLRSNVGIYYFETAEPKQPERVKYRQMEQQLFLEAHRHGKPKLWLDWYGVIADLNT
jgi:hypothetical protein